MVVDAILGGGGGAVTAKVAANVWEIVHRVYMSPGNPGKVFKPWKPLEKPWNYFLSPGKSHRTLLKK